MGCVVLNPDLDNHPQGGQIPHVLLLCWLNLLGGEVVFLINPSLSTYRSKNTRPPIPRLRHSSEVPVVLGDMVPSCFPSLSLLPGPSDSVQAVLPSLVRSTIYKWNSFNSHHASLGTHWMEGLIQRFPTCGPQLFGDVCDKSDMLRIKYLYYDS